MLEIKEINNILKNHGIDFIFKNGLYSIIEDDEVVEIVKYKNINSISKIRKFLNY